jgi:hypothetical protein
MKYLAALGIAALVFAATPSNRMTSPAPMEQLATINVGDMAPDLAFPDPSGKTRKL